VLINLTMCKVTEHLFVLMD